jgi:hypothetical protein
MSSSQERLDEWWASLSPEEQQAALAAQKNGRLTPGLMASLEQAGAIPSGQSAGGSLPSGVDQYLKARH